jgi:hypothetical protein
MLSQTVSFNILAVILCIICNMVLGALWYSPVLFGTAWLRLVGKNKEDISSGDAMKSMLLSLIPAALSIVFLAVILSLVQAATFADAIIIGSIISIGFIGMTTMNQVIYEDRQLKLIAINVGYTFATYNIAAVILTLWK